MKQTPVNASKPLMQAILYLDVGSFRPQQDMMQEIAGTTYQQYSSILQTS